jgi:hypothetical protein
MGSETTGDRCKFATTPAPSISPVLLWNPTGGACMISKLNNDGSSANKTPRHSQNRAASSALAPPASSVEHLANLPQEHVASEGLLQEGDASLEASLTNDRVVCVAGDVEDVQPRVPAGEPIEEGRTASTQA